MNLGIAFGIAALFLLIPDAYIVFGVMKETSWCMRGLFLLPTILYFFVIIKTFFFKEPNQTMINLVLWSTLVIFFPILIFTIVSLLGLGLSCFYNPLYRVFNWIALGLGCIWFLGAMYGITMGWKKVTIESDSLNFPTLPTQFNGYKIVQLSDFHIGTYSSSPETVRRIIKKVNSLHPDLIVFTGDLVNTSPDEIKPFIDDLKQLKAKDGVISILGNHDYCLYRSYTAPDSPQRATQEVIDLERDLGWIVSP